MRILILLGKTRITGRVATLFFFFSFCACFIPQRASGAERGENYVSIQYRKGLTSDSIPLLSLIRQIEGSTRYLFTYIDADVLGVTVVRSSGKNIKKILSDALRSTNLDFIISGYNISLFKKPQRETERRTSQPNNNSIRILNGTVCDVHGNPIVGAVIVEKGTSNSTVTDQNGHYYLKVSDGSKLQISSLGYIGNTISVDDKSQILSPDARTDINIQLREHIEQVDEIVIVGYGVQKKINATGAVKTIDSSVLESRPLTNAVQGLQGTISGLNITNDNGGELGMPMQINIRGVGSIGDGSNASPLILIDGMEGDLFTINPNDIENISVLKDAAAASIYGSRAPFGVILITTKSGKHGFRLNYSDNLRVSQPLKVPDMVDGYTFALMMNDAYLNSGGTAPFGTAQLNKIQSYMNGSLTYATEPWENDPNRWKMNQACFGNTDWYDVYLKKATFSQEHNVSLTGGGEKVTYYLSANYLNQSGLFNYADERYRRLGITGKVNVMFNDRVSLRWDTRMINIDNDKPSALNVLFYHNLGRRAAVAPLYMPNGEYSQDSMVEAMLHGGRTNQKTQQLYNQASLLIEPIRGWQIHANVSSRTEHDPYTRQFKPISHSLPDGTQEYMQVLEGIIAKHTISTDGSFIVQPFTGESYYEKATTSVNYFSTNVYTDYTLKLSSHQFKFLVGEQSEYYHIATDRMASTNILLSATPFLPSEIGGKSTMISEKKAEWSSLGFFGRMNYNYKDRYMAEFNIRADGASRFPTNGRWATFPSFSAGWNIAKERFWDKWSNAVSHFKLRASYGVLGNQNTTSFYPYYQQMSSTAGSLVLGGSQATILPMYKPYSSYLTWEKIHHFNAGIDWYMLDNRLSGSFDWYQRTTKDMVGPARAMSALYGAAAPKTNNAELRTRGWEIELNWRDKIGPNFKYGIRAQLSNYSTVITKYDSPDNAISGWYKGKKYGDIWGYEVIGIAKSDAEMNAYLAQHSQSSIGSNWGGGDLMYRNLDSDPAINKGSGTLSDHGDLKVIGNATPKYSYSVTLDANWKWLDCSAYFQGVGRRDVFFDGSATFFGISAEWQRSLFTNHLDYFRYAGSPLGANFDSYYGRLRIDQNNIQVCDRFLQNAAYLRLKNLQLGISLDRLCSLPKFVQRARVYFSGENLFTLTNLRIYDPEAIGSTDGEYGPGYAYYQYRTYSLGLSITF